MPKPKNEPAFPPYSLTGMTFTNNPKTESDIRQMLKVAMAQAAYAVFAAGVTLKGVKYGVTTPNLYRVCMEIADDTHAEIHSTIESELGDTSAEDDDLPCPICGWPAAQERKQIMAKMKKNHAARKLKTKKGES